MTAAAEGETLDDQQDAGMVHLVYVSASGSIDEIAATPEHSRHRRRARGVRILWADDRSGCRRQRSRRRPRDNEIMLGWAAVGEPALGIVEASGQYLYLGGRERPLLGQLAVRHSVAEPPGGHGLAAALSADGLHWLTVAALRCCTGCGPGRHGA